MRSPRMLLAVALCASGIGVEIAHGQAIPPFTPPAVPAAPVAPAVPAAPAAPGGLNIWTMLCPPPAMAEKCKAHLCNSFIGQMLGAMLQPMRLMTGAKPCCPQPGMPTAADLLKDPTSATGAAARIKQEEADAKARRADVRFLGTVDCSRYPEAEKALIKALRTDRNECVRWEAAMALGNACCCTRGTVEALALTVNGSDKDENPVETSPRVRQAAAIALANCMSRTIEPPSPPEKPAPLPPESAPPPEKRLPSGLGRVPEPAPPRVMPIAFATAAPPTPMTPMTYSTTGFPLRPNPTPEPEPSAGIPTGQRGLLQLFMRRVQPARSN